jgi:putative phosphoesterase
MERSLMRIALLADSHDRVPAIQALGQRIADAGAGLVLHAGDYCSPFALRSLTELNPAMAGVFGRNDGDHEGLRAEAARAVGVELYESPHSVELDGRRLLLVHDIGEVHERSLEAHDIVVHGCTHEYGVTSLGRTLVLNPGEACGWLFGAPTAMLLDLRTNEWELIRLDGPEWRL